MDKGVFTPPRRYNSPSLRGKRVIGPLPEGEKQWQESLRSDEEAPTFGPGLRELKETRLPSEDELSTMVTVAMRELRHSDLSEASGHSHNLETEDAKRHFIESVVKRALFGANDSQDQRQSHESWISRISQSSQVLTEGPRSRSPPASSRSQRHSEFVSDDALKQALQASQAKYRRLEELYAQLLTTDTPPRSSYKRKYEELRDKYTREQVLTTQAIWSDRLKAVQHQIELREVECRRLSESRSSNVYSQLQEELEQLKARVARTEEDHQAIKAKVMAE